MAQNDMHVVMYKILAYVYSCMKEGQTPDRDEWSSGRLGIPNEYWKQIVRELVEHGYITGVGIRPSQSTCYLDVGVPRVTMDGVEFLMENSMMAKARQFLIDTKSAIPFA